MQQTALYNHNKPQEKDLEILLISDNQAQCQEIIKSLSESKDEEFTFYTAASGAEALALMQKKFYDCVFMDQSLKDMSGLDVLRKLFHEHSTYVQSPCIIISPQSDTIMMTEALRFGAHDYILGENISPDLLKVSLKRAKEIFELKKSWKQASEQIHNARKMEAMGQLTGGVAHDFNNLLTIIMGNIHLVRKRINSVSDGNTLKEINEKIDIIDTAAVKGADLVRRLMVFTRQSPLSQEIVDTNECIKETFELLRRTLGENVEIETILADTVGKIAIDVHEFENVMINFAVNARDAMPKGGKLTIETSNVILDEAYTFRHPEVTSGAYIMIAISDTGIGMPPEVLNRVFEPFFTTKEEGEGTGLGMSMAYGFVRQCGGHIYVYSEVGHGTVFRIYLPKVAEENDEASQQDNVPYISEGETVLIVEDDDVVRAVAATMLEKMGYKVMQASNGRVAIEILKREHKKIDIVFTDIIMPGGISGIELVRQMREYYPGIKVLYTSGYTQNAIPEYQLSAGEELISKPYRKEQLAEKMRKVLDVKAA